MKKLKICFKHHQYIAETVDTCCPFCVSDKYVHKLISIEKTFGAGNMLNFDNGYDAGIDEAIGLVRDYSDRKNNVYTSDVISALKVLKS